MKHFLLLFILLSILVSCQKDKDISKKDKDISLEQEMNEFIEYQMEDIYLWADHVKGRNIDIDKKPSDFLEAMMYKEKDRWSHLEINDESTKASIDGYEMTFGYRIKFYDVVELEKIIGMIQYVYPSTPAAAAGLKRGDMVVMNNGEYLYMENYFKVMTDANVLLKTATIHDDTLLISKKEYSLSARKAVLNPILLDTILEIGDKKIGYFVYSKFVDNGSNSLNDLSKAIGQIKAESIDEFILDLRHNNGGRLSAAKRLSNLLAPASAVQNKEILLYKQWNEKYQQQFQEIGETEDHFDPSTLADNLNLSDIYILTGEWTASASEVVISGLRPYMTNTILIGETTVGKYVGTSQLLPKEKLQKWTLWPVTFSYTNVNGEDVKGGIEPTYPIGENIGNLPPFGSLSDPLLVKAIELINGEATVASLQTLSSKATGSWRLLDDKDKSLLIR